MDVASDESARDGAPVEGQDTGERFNFRLELHAKLTKGGSLYVYRCDDFGLTYSCVRETRGSPWVHRYAAEALDGREFASLNDVVAALRGVAAVADR